MGAKVKAYAYTLDGRFIKGYDCIKDAAADYGVLSACIANALNGVTKTSVGCLWRYYKVEQLPADDIPQQRSARPLYQYDMDGTYIAEFNSPITAARVLNTTPAGFREAANGKLKSRAGYLWRFYRCDTLPAEELPTYGKRNLSPVSQYTMDGQFVRSYPSITEAANAVGRSSCNIKDAAVGRISSSAGFLWRHLEVPQLSEDELAKTRSRDKTVYQYDPTSGKLLRAFPSVKCAAAFCETSPSAIGAAAQGRVRSSSGYLWSYERYESISISPLAKPVRRRRARKTEEESKKE